MPNPNQTTEHRAFDKIAKGLREARAMIPEMDGWSAAFQAACSAADLFPPDTDKSLHRFGAETVVRAIYKAAGERGIHFPWPTRFGGMP